MRTATAPEPPEQPQQTAADRLLRAQAAELEALRARVADLPDPDALLEMRAKAEKFDALVADLPGWKEQLQAAHQQEQQALQQRLQEQEGELTRERLQSELQAQFLRAGGNPLHFSAWLELYGSKYVKPGEDGRMVSTENGQTIPLEDVLNNQRTDPLYGVLYHPRYGSGGGSRQGNVDGRVTTVNDLSKMKTSDLFKTAFAGNRI